MPYAKVGPWVNGAPPALSAANLDQIETQYEEAMTDAVPRVRKTADEPVNNSTVFQNDDHLLFAAAANEVWELTLICRTQSATIGDRFKFQLSLPAGAVFHGMVWNVDNTGTPAWFFYEGGIRASYMYDSVQCTAIIKGIFVNGANAGNFQFQWAQNTAAAEDSKVLTNSCIVSRQIA